MKFILNKDTFEIQEHYLPNSGSVNYYEIEVEYDESWNNLSIAVVIKNKKEEIGISRAVINNKVFIDKELSGTYQIGFVGYTIENEKKVYQISTPLEEIRFIKGAGEIETINSADIPTPTEWEIYIAQIQDMLDNYSGVPDGGTTGQALVKKSDEDGDVEWQTIEGSGSVVVPAVINSTLVFFEGSNVTVEGKELVFA